MKINLALFLSIISLVLLIEVITYLSSSYQYPLFYFKGVDNELPAKLYGKLDPLLGYTFDREIKPSQKELKHYLTLDKSWNTYGSYISFEHGAVENSKRIVILGGSATDSNLYNGNWVYFFHLLLKEKDIPHRILNGAVSGYSSNQELLKLQRDFQSLGEVDLIIVYNGVNDTVVNEDVMIKHPWIHPYEYYLYQKLARVRTKLIHPTILPNLNVFVSSLLKKESFKVDLGFLVEDYVGRFLLNLDFLKLAAERKGANFLHVLQPIGWEKSLRANEFSDTRGVEFLENVKSFYKKAQEERGDHSLNMTRLLNLNQKYFLDYTHMNDAGNTTSAEIIFEDLKQKGWLR